MSEDSILVFESDDLISSHIELISCLFVLISAAIYHDTTVNDLLVDLIDRLLFVIDPMADHVLLEGVEENPGLGVLHHCDNVTTDLLSVTLEKDCILPPSESIL